MDTIELTGYDNQPIKVTVSRIIGIEAVRDGAVLRMRGGGSLTVQESATYVRSLLPGQGVVTR